MLGEKMGDMLDAPAFDFLGWNRQFNGWRERIEHQIEALERRIVALEGCVASGSAPSVARKGVQEFFEAGLEMPCVWEGGLGFQHLHTYASFNQWLDGWWHSVDALFLSPRNIGGVSPADSLTKYLESEDFRACLASKLPASLFGDYVDWRRIRVALPAGEEGVKKLNGLPVAYWLDKKAETDAYRAVSSEGRETSYTQTDFLGVVICFKVGAVSGDRPV